MYELTAEVELYTRERPILVIKANYIAPQDRDWADIYEALEFLTSNGYSWGELILQEVA